MVSRIPTNTLINIAAWGAVITSGTGYYLKNRYVDWYTNRDFYQDAIKKLQQSAGAVYFLGEPIKNSVFRITDSVNNFCDEKIAKFKVPVWGPKKKGYYYFWATNMDGEWSLDKAELEIDGEPGRRLIIIKSANVSNTTSEKNTHKLEHN